MIKINEIFYSIQGESTYAGEPCIFIRLTYCNLRCAYCDTEYAFTEGEDFSIEEILEKIKIYDCKLVEITGGEPLVQKESLGLMEKLCGLGYKVLLETGGSLSIKEVDRRVKIIMDVKCPSSGMAEKNLYDNFKHIKPDDELKFVIGGRDDFDWSVSILKKYSLEEKFTIHFSPVFGDLKSDALAEWILKENIKARLQLQLHKFIWEPNKRGV